MPAAGPSSRSLLTNGVMPALTRGSTGSLPCWIPGRVDAGSPRAVPFAAARGSAAAQVLAPRRPASCLRACGSCFERPDEQRQRVAEQRRRDRRPRRAERRGPSPSSAPRRRWRRRARPPDRARDRTSAAPARENPSSISRRSSTPAASIPRSRSSRWARTHSSTNRRKRSGSSRRLSIHRSLPASGRSRLARPRSNSSRCSASCAGALLLGERQQQLLLAAEVAVDGALGEPGLGRDLVERRAVEAAPCVDARGGIEQAGARLRLALAAIELTARHRRRLIYS